MNEKTTKVTLKKTKDCRSCVRFDATDDKAPVRNVYVNRPLADKWASVTITLEGSEQ